jgi:glucokinase
MQDYSNDSRVVLTLDAGGTNFVFSAMQGHQAVVESFSLPANGDHLERSLATLVDGFTRARDAAPQAPVAISFAFPAPADYVNGIVSPGNLPGYRDVALKAFLEEKFGLPVFLNNDGDLFTYGEAAAGFLPYVNGLLEKAGSPKRFQNLIGVTLGTGLGGGIVRNGDLYAGDNSVAGEIWLMRHKRDFTTNAEEGASIRAVRRVYAARTATKLENAPDPRTIAAIARGEAPGDPDAAREAFRQMGEIAGDVIAQLATILDGLIVIGGGMAAAHDLFLPAILDEMRAPWKSVDGEKFPRLIPRLFDLTDEAQLQAFLQGETREVTVPGSTRTVRFDGLQRIGIGITRLGTSEATSIGAYAFALDGLAKGGRA